MYQAAVYRILIASPKDVVAERRAIPEVIHSWNATNSSDERVVLLPVMYETHSTPEMGDRPQAIVNKQLVRDCDILIGAFWTRIGTHTGVAESGTLEEIKEFRAAGKPVMLYFSNRPVVPESVDPEQYAQLKQFREQCRKEGLVDDYDSVEELREKAGRHLTSTVRRMKSQGVGPGPKAPESGPSPATPPTGPSMLAKQLEARVYEYEAEWRAERDSEPLDIDGGKTILGRLGRDLVSFSSSLRGSTGDETLGLIHTLVTESRRLQRHELYIDGGKSYREFWDSGNAIFESLNDVVRRLNSESTPEVSIFEWSSKSFDKVIRPEIEQDWEITYSNPARVEERRLSGWEEVYWPDSSGRRRQVVFKHAGVVDSVPLRRRKLSELAKQLLVAAFKHTEGNISHALLFKPDPPSFGIAGTRVEGRGAIDLRDQFVIDGLVEEPPPPGYVYRLTKRGLTRAQEIASKLGT